MEQLKHVSPEYQEQLARLATRLIRAEVQLELDLLSYAEIADDLVISN